MGIVHQATLELQSHFARLVAQRNLPTTHHILAAVPEHELATALTNGTGEGFCFFVLFFCFLFFLEGGRETVWMSTSHPHKAKRRSKEVHTPFPFLLQGSPLLQPLG